jgi:hypothetical protein
MNDVLVLAVAFFAAATPYTRSCSSCPVLAQGTPNNAVA